ncbi:FAD assembly factor SdhE [Pararhodobacter sp.]|jgi:antitoxin CptB|uniref:FAD assembly factor SdhE n=1 Tax=Pararhodobacter sp. TaxID=2127056 RepID=UPI002FDCAFDA
MSEDTELKRLRMRSWRRGIKEMDLILGPFADTALAALDAPARALFDALLEENDHDLYLWLTARIGPNPGAPGPARYGDLLDRIAAHAASRIVPG